MLAAIDDYAAKLAQRLAALPASSPAAQKLALAAAVKIATDASAQMTAQLTAAVAENRSIAFNEVFGMWQSAGRSAAKAVGVPDALLGAVATPNLTMAGSFEALGGVPYLRSLTATGKAAGAEVATIIREGITASVRPDEIARRLRPYVSGAEAFEKAFPKADDRFKAMHTSRAKLPPELRGAAGRIRSNSLRIAYSEIHNARAEAELQAFALDPLVASVQWELSPFRGSQADPDPCDLFAVNDWYGLGKGVYPLDAVPLPPHPRDRCERVPVQRPPEEWHQPKPSNLKRKLKPANAALGPNASQITAAAAKNVRDVVRGQLQQLDQMSAKGPMRKLMQYGNEAAGELLEIAAARQTLLADLAAIAQAAEAAAAAAAAEPTTIGMVTFPTKLEGDALVAAKALYKKASHKSTAALQALKDAGADTSALNAHLAAQKAAAKAKKQAKAQAPQAKPITAPPVEPPAPPVPPPAVPQQVPTGKQGLLSHGYGPAELQDAAKQEGVYLLTKKQLSDPTIQQLLADALDHGDTAAIAQLKAIGAKTDVLEKKLGLKAVPAAPPTPGPVPATPPPAPLPTAAPVAPPPAVDSAENILHQKVGAQAGSNQGGFYVGKDGVKRYVKVYADPAQAHGEHLANVIYRKLGLGAPDSVTFTHNGQLHYASRIIAGAENATVKQLGLTAERAKRALDGFAADILTANWDAPGLGLDNMVDVGGKLYRIDNGSAFLFRAQGGRKPANLLDKITEWDGFAPGAKNLNADYANLFKTAGYSGPEDMGAALVQQIDDILALEKQVGGWAKLIDDAGVDLKIADRAAIEGMLNSRVDLLRQKRDAIAAGLTKHTPPPAPITAPPPAAVAAVAAPPTHAGIQPLTDVGALKAALAGKKALGVKKIANQHGIWLSKYQLNTPAKVKEFKEALVQAVQGDMAAVAKLKKLGAQTTYLESQLNAAYVKAGVVPPAVPVPPPPPAAVPHVPAGVLIKPTEVDGVFAASEVKVPLYWQGGNTSLAGLKATGVDLAKLPSGQFGFALETAVGQLKPTSKGYAKIVVASKNPLKVVAADSPAAVDAAIEKLLPGWAKLTGDVAKREFLTDKGYDTLVISGPGGAPRAVIALKPEIVKVVDEAVQPLAPPPGMQSFAHVTAKVDPVHGTYSGVPKSQLPSWSDQNPPPKPPGYIANAEADHGPRHATAALDRSHANWRSKLTPSEAKAVSDYTGSAYGPINNALRAGRAPGGAFAATRKNIASAIDKLRTTDDLILYRGLGADHPYVQMLRHKGLAAMQQDLVGEINHDLGFMSTSTRQEVARRFATSERVYLEVRAPKGTPGFWAKLHGHFQGDTGEHELLLTEKQDYRILEVREENPTGDGPRIRIIVELVL